MYVRRVTLTSTMGPAVRVDTNQAMALENKE
jgi:ribosomal protein L1